MKKQRKRKQTTNPGKASDKSKSPRRNRVGPISLAIVGVVSAIIVGPVIWHPSEKAGAASTYVPRPHGTLTFSKDVAPIVFQNCAPCHRPGQSAPFALLSYSDVNKRAKQIGEVTARRYMPPWLPEPGYGEFADVRRLTTDQLGVIQQWLAEGGIEGKPEDLPPTPKWAEGWQLGEPDLVVRLPQPYTLAAEGKDVYRNLVIPIPVPERRYVKAVEFQPGDSKVIHHAFINVDRTLESRRLAQKETPPGYPGAG